jgi:hypothetical protein
MAYGHFMLRDGKISHSIPELTVTTKEINSLMTARGLGLPLVTILVEARMRRRRVVRVRNLARCPEEFKTNA